MNDPVQIERRFQDVMGQFEQSESIRYRYRQFTIFTEALGGDYKKYSSYLIQFISGLHQFSVPLTWFGIKPKELERYIIIMDEISSAVAELKDSRYFQNVSGRLREVCVLMYCCLNEAKPASIHVNRLFRREMGFESYIEKLDRLKYDNLIPLLSDFLNMHRDSQADFSSTDKETFKRLGSDLQALMKIPKGNVFVPVVEKYESEDGKWIEFGRLRKLSVEIYGMSEDRDELRRNFPVFGAEKPVMIDNDNLVLPPRKLAEEKTTWLKNKYFKGLISYELSGARHEGDSANLAIAALWHTCLIMQADGKEHYVVNPFSAISGNIQSDGKVLPVDKESIQLKVQAAFFSCCPVLIVPDEQKPLFIQELHKLKQKYPDKVLDIIGVRKFEDLFFDRRAAHQVEKNLLIHYSGWLWKHKSHYLAWIVIIFLSGFLLFQIYGPIDKNPASFHLQGEYLVLTNSAGFEVMRILLDSETANYQNQGSNMSRKPLVVLYDITGDQINDVIWATRGEVETKETSSVQAFSVQGDSLIWKVDLMQNYSFPRQSADLRTGLRTHEIGLIEVGQNDVRLIVNSDSYIYFPAVVTTLDISTGEILSEYLHIGQLLDMLLVDLTDDGIEEIILTGVNNAYWNASIVVLDPRNSHGYSPLTADYIPEGLERASEIAYLLVPKTKIGEYVQTIEKLNFGTTMHYDEASERFWVRIEEGRRTFRDLENPIFILQYLDRSLKPAGVGTSNMYDIIARELYDEGTIPFIPDYDYFKAFQDSLLYWNGEGFVKAFEWFNE